MAATPKALRALAEVAMDSLTPEGQDYLRASLLGYEDNRCTEDALVSALQMLLRRPEYRRRTSYAPPCQQPTPQVHEPPCQQPTPQDMDAFVERCYSLFGCALAQERLECFACGRLRDEDDGKTMASVVELCQQCFAAFRFEMADADVRSVHGRTSVQCARLTALGIQVATPFVWWHLVARKQTVQWSRRDANLVAALLSQDGIAMRVFRDQNKTDSTPFEDLLMEEAQLHFDCGNQLTQFSPQELGAVKHGLKVMLRGYDALQHTCCCGCRTAHDLWVSTKTRLDYRKTGLCHRCFRALDVAEDLDPRLQCCVLTDEGMEVGQLLVALMNREVNQDLMAAHHDAAAFRNIMVNYRELAALSRLHLCASS
eukprot:s849_g8.t1